MLGRSGLEVSALGLGCMGMSEFYGATDEAQSLATLHRAFELGVTFLDTADVYGPHTNEELIGRAIKGRRDDVTIATKFGGIRGPGDGRRFRGDAGYVSESCDASLRRLGVDTIDLFYLHRVDPTVPIEEVGDWKAADTSATVLEKVFGENTLRPIAFLARGLEIARAVAKVRVTTSKGRKAGTAFLLTPDLAITNHHVVGSADLLPDVDLIFNYQNDFDDQPQPIDKYAAKVGGVFKANQTLDYAVFELDRAAGEEWGHLPLSGRGIKKGERINIIQHPYGQPKQISFQNNLVEYADANVLQYVTATDPGASGSPVLNDKWEVVGVHPAGGRLQEPQTRRFYNRNEGIRVDRILADLPADIRARIEAAAV
jgi:V8-like Glu-specific endopeptidase